MTQSTSLLETFLSQLGAGGVEQIGRSVGLNARDVGSVLAGDGDPIDDLVRVGSKLLGSFLK